ncbi:MAG TPA: histidine kinase [Longimicrobiales bacterium]
MTTASRRRVIVGVMAFAAVGAVLLVNALIVRSAPAADPVVIATALLAVTALTAIAGWQTPLRHVGVVTLGAAMVSIAGTLLHTPHEVPREAFWILLELAALLTLLILATRWAATRIAVVSASAAVAAISLTALRSGPAASTETLVGVVFGMVVAGAAAAAGLYLRTLDQRRVRTIVDTRRTQRLELARDLHDFVAHDVTGIVVQAQAARVVADRDVNEALSALSRIEQTGLHALASLDRTLRALRDVTDGTGQMGPANEDATGQPDVRATELADVLGLIDRFASADHIPVRLHLAPRMEQSVPRNVASTAYHVVLEALTNVRRHAPETARVDVFISMATTGTSPALVLRVTNAADGGSAQPANDSRQGFGLRGLAERVDGIGGMFAAGPDDNGWQVAAILPFG